jgi:protein-arginine kinase activator protein McsA
MSGETDNLMWFPDDEPLRCPECHEDVKRADWIGTSVGCSDCGDHAAIECPQCGEAFDHVWGPRRFDEEPVR